MANPPPDRRIVVGAVLLAVAVAVIVAVVLSRSDRHRVAAPTTTTGPPNTQPYTTTPSPFTTTTTEPPPAAPTTVSNRPAPTLPGPDAGQKAAADGYLKAFNNSISYYQATPTSWPDRAKPFLTPAMYARLTAPTTPGNSTGGDYSYRTAHANGWSVMVDVRCAFDQTAAQSTATTASLLCDVTDLTVDKTGTPVPLRSLPGAWAYTGRQQQATLALQNVGGTWLVAADRTAVSYS